ncbi:unnamed protein product [Calypogeia fissa]
MLQSMVQKCTYVIQTYTVQLVKWSEQDKEAEVRKRTQQLQQSKDQQSKARLVFELQLSISKQKNLDLQSQLETFQQSKDQQSNDFQLQLFESKQKKLDLQSQLETFQQSKDQQSNEFQLQLSESKQKLEDLQSQLETVQQSRDQQFQDLNFKLSNSKYVIEDLKCKVFDDEEKQRAWKENYCLDLQKTIEDQAAEIKSIKAHNVRLYVKIMRTEKGFQVDAKGRDILEKRLRAAEVDVIKSRKEAEQLRKQLEALKEGKLPAEEQRSLGSELQLRITNGSKKRKVADSEQG